VIGAALAMLLTLQPGAAGPAQTDAYDFSCATSERHAELRVRVAESYLEDAFAASPALKQEFAAAIQPCIAAQGLDEDAASAYLRASLATLLMIDFEARIRAAGFDFTAIEALVEARREDPDLDTEGYVDARPAIFATQFAQLAAQQGFEPGYLEELLGGYLGFVGQLDRAMEALGAL
jgi:hypothetical protein